MTDFSKVREYYKKFDENSRLLSDNSGRLEYEMTMKLLEKHLPAHAKILDLGGAAGIYSFPLTDMGHEVWLADLSEKLIEEAKVKNEGRKNKIRSCEVVNAIDLSRYLDESFDVVLLFGPLYHLTEKTERQACISEVNRVLKTDGFIFASFIPHLSGSIALLDRYLAHPEQVDERNLSEAFSEGRFHNASDSGFQEGYYPAAKEIQDLFCDCRFSEIEMRSIRGIAYEKEDKLYAITDEKMFRKVMEMIELTADRKEIIEMCGHAMYIGKKKE